MSNIDARRSQAQLQQQQALRAPAPAFIRACPGAGKTRVLVDRHCLTPPGPRRAGRALLSFTNVAADELRERCSGSRPDLTAFPHYIGTFDSFLWRYLVRPFLPASPPWQHVLSWDQIPGAVVGPRKVPLSVFQFSYDPTTRLSRVQWPKPGKHLINSELSQEEYVIRAKRRRDQLWQTRGYMTGHATTLETRPSPISCGTASSRSLSTRHKTAPDSISPSSSTCTTRACPWSSSPTAIRASTNGTTPALKISTPSPSSFPTTLN